MSSARRRCVRRRYHVMLALRWIPSGLFVTVFVLLMQERGLSLAEIGLGAATQGIVMLVLELPSGGLADTLGRRPVLLLAGCLGITASSLLLVADDVALLAVAFAVQGASRALDSGTLQAWFVDAVLAVDPSPPLERDLARGDVTTCASIGAGALLGSAIVRLDGLPSVDPLVAPLAVAIVVQAVGVVAVGLLVDEPRRAGAGRLPDGRSPACPVSSARPSA